MENVVRLISIQKSITTEKGNHLICAHFKDASGKSYLWIPKWKDIRILYGNAVAREGQLYGTNTKEMKKFLEQIHDIPTRLVHYQEMFEERKKWK